MGLIILASRYLTQKGNYCLRLSLAIIYISSVLVIHPMLFSINQWHYQTSLPLHMCELSEIFAAIVLIWPNQRLFEILCYWGIPGGIHSILTPELVHAGEESWLVIHYYIQHTGIILVPIWLMSTFQMRLSRQSWLKVFFITNLFLKQFFEGKNIKRDQGDFFQFFQKLIKKITLLSARDFFCTAGY